MIVPGGLNARGNGGNDDTSNSLEYHHCCSIVRVFGGHCFWNGLEVGPGG